MSYRIRASYLGFWIGASLFSFINNDFSVFSVLLLILCLIGFVIDLYAIKLEIEDTEMLD